MDETIASIRAAHNKRKRKATADEENDGPAAEQSSTTYPSLEPLMGSASSNGKRSWPFEREVGQRKKPTLEVPQATEMQIDTITQQYDSLPTAPTRRDSATTESDQVLAQINDETRCQVPAYECDEPMPTTETESVYEDYEDSFNNTNVSVNGTVSISRALVRRSIWNPVLGKFQFLASGASTPQIQPIQPDCFLSHTLAQHSPALTRPNMNSQHEPYPTKESDLTASQLEKARRRKNKFLVFAKSEVKYWGEVGEEEVRAIGKLPLVSFYELNKVERYRWEKGEYPFRSMGRREGRKTGGGGELGGSEGLRLREETVLLARTREESEILENWAGLGAGVEDGIQEESEYSVYESEEVEESEAEADKVDMKIEESDYETGDSEGLSLNRDDTDSEDD